MPAVRDCRRSRDRPAGTRPPTRPRWPETRSTSSSSPSTGRSTRGPPWAAIVRTVAPNRSASSAAITADTSASRDPSMPTTIEVGDQSAPSGPRATSTEQGACCSSDVATLPSITPARRPPPCVPTAARVADSRSSAARSAGAGAPSRIRASARGMLRSCSQAASRVACARSRASAARGPAVAPARAGTVSQTVSVRMCAGSVRSRVAWRSASKPAGEPSTPHTMRSKIMSSRLRRVPRSYLRPRGQLVRAARIVQRAARGGDESGGRAPRPAASPGGRGRPARGRADTARRCCARVRRRSGRSRFRSRDLGCVGEEADRGGKPRAGAGVGQLPHPRQHDLVSRLPHGMGDDPPVRAIAQKLDPDGLDQRRTSAHSAAETATAARAAVEITPSATAIAAPGTGARWGRAGRRITRPPPRYPQAPSSRRRRVAASDGAAWFTLRPHRVGGPPEGRASRAGCDDEDGARGGVRWGRRDRHRWPSDAGVLRA